MSEFNIILGMSFVMSTYGHIILAERDDFEGEQMYEKGKKFGFFLRFFSIFIFLLLFNIGIGGKPEGGYIVLYIFGLIVVSFIAVPISIFILQKTIKK